MATRARGKSRRKATATQDTGERSPSIAPGDPPLVGWQNPAESFSQPQAWPFTADILRGLSPEGQSILIESLTPAQQQALKYDWEFWARPDQLTPLGDWLVWLILAGRGFGKTRTLVEKVRERVVRGGCRHIALVGATADDVRGVLVEGESGLLACSPPWERPKFEPSKRRLLWPNGAVGITFSADEPDRFRGYQHDFAALDEVAAWKYAQASFDMLMFGLRLGINPQCVIATTPRPIDVIKSLIKQPTTHVTRGSTYANSANLPPMFLNQILSKYQGTRLGRQEIDAALLEDTPGALWTETTLEATRRFEVGKWPDGLPILPYGVQIYRTVIGVDPSGRIADMARLAAGLPLLGGSSKTGDEAGIVVCGKGDDEHGYVLRDASTEGSPDVWGNRVVDEYEFWGADAVVVEYNHGGETAEEVIQACAKKRGLPPLNVIRVWASKGKYTRAEPISAMYEQFRIHHVGSADEFAAMEDEMTTFVPGRPSPNRLDAAVFGLTNLMIGMVSQGGCAVGGPKRSDVPIGRTG